MERGSLQIHKHGHKQHLGRQGKNPSTSSTQNPRPNIGNSKPKLNPNHNSTATSSQQKENTPPSVITQPTSTRNVAFLKTQHNPIPSKTPSPIHRPNLQWHLKLNQAYPGKLATTAKQRLPRTIPHNFQYGRITCSACQHAKISPAQHWPKRQSCSIEAYVSSNACGPIKPTSFHSNNHMLLIICATIKILFVHFLNEKEGNLSIHRPDTAPHSETHETPSSGRSERQC